MVSKANRVKTRRSQLKIFGVSLVHLENRENVLRGGWSKWKIVKMTVLQFLPLVNIDKRR